MNVLMAETIDLGEYPESHMYMFYTNSESVSPSVHSALDSMSDCMGLKISEMLCKASKTLDKATAGSRHNPVDLEGGDPMDIDFDHGKSGERRPCTTTVRSTDLWAMRQSSLMTPKITIVKLAVGHPNLPSINQVHLLKSAAEATPIPLQPMPAYDMILVRQKKPDFGSAT